MNWKLLFLPVAIVAELANVPLVLTNITHGETGFGNWVLDRKIGDQKGKWWQTRAQAQQRKGEK